MKYKIVLCDIDVKFCKNMESSIVSVMSAEKYDFDIQRYNNPKLLILDYVNLRMDMDILFIDVILGDQSGLEVAGSLRDMGFQGSIVFVTSSADYSLQCYSVYPLYYFLKPVNTDKLREVLRKDYLSHVLSRPLQLKQNGDELLIRTNEIVYCEMVSRKIQIVTENKTFSYSGTLKELENALSGLPFARCHKGYIVNLDRMIYMCRYSLSLLLSSGKTIEIPIGRTYYNNTFKLLKKKMNLGSPVHITSRSYF